MARSKKDIDRELMYKKILPTAVSTENTFDKTTRDNREEIAPQNIPSATLEVNIQKPVEVIVASPPVEERSQKLPEEQPEEP
ncbi:hypothetical protein ACS3UN_01385 [Oscillospiraceae bacterium LTW-04]